MSQPRCTHARTGIVTSGDPKRGPHAATDVCSRLECIYDAQRWATSVTDRESWHIPDVRQP